MAYEGRAGEEALVAGGRKEGGGVLRVGGTGREGRVGSTDSLLH